jgi:hypothetical protein
MMMQIVKDRPGKKHRINYDDANSERQAWKKT